MFNFITRAQIKVTRWLNRPSREYLERLSCHYREDVIGEEANGLMKNDDFNKLLEVARYADFGVWTAIQAAYCLGYAAGKGVAGGDGDVDMES